MRAFTLQPIDSFGLTFIVVVTFFPHAVVGCATPRCSHILHSAIVSGTRDTFDSQSVSLKTHAHHRIGSDFVIDSCMQRQGPLVIGHQLDRITPACLDLVTLVIRRITRPARFVMRLLYYREAVGSPGNNKTTWLFYVAPHA